MKLGQLLYSIATYIPGVNDYFRKATGGTDSARYCYSVWLRHLVMAHNNGLDVNPKVIAELGPGDSLGMGLAALLTGSEKYYAFDVVEHANVERNLLIFDELINLFKNKTNIPGENEFPLVKPYLACYDFPVTILDDNRLMQSLELSRLEVIRNSIINPRIKDSVIQYKIPWYDISTLNEESVDLIFSQAVLEHVDELLNTYKSMKLWLKSTGYISNQIDFKSHDTADTWDGHWGYSDLMWKLIKANKPYLINREPLSTHIGIMEENGFKIVCIKMIKSDSNLPVSKRAKRFKLLSFEDSITSGAFIQAIKKS